MAMTFHAFCYALVRRFADRVEPGTDGLGAAGAAAHRPGAGVPGPGDPARAASRRGGPHWPDSLARRLPDPGVRRRDPGGAGPRPAARAWTPTTWSPPARPPAARSGSASASSSTSTSTCSDAEGVLDYAELVHRCRILLADPDVVGAAAVARSTAVFVDEYQDTDPAQVRLLQAIAGDGRDVVVVGDPDQSIYAFRGAEARGILDFPDRFRTAGGAPGAGARPERRPGGSGRRCWRPAATSPAGSGCRGRCPPDVFADFRRPGPAPGLPRGSVEVFTCTTAGRRGRAHRRDPARRPPARRARPGTTWPCWSGPAGPRSPA